MNRILIYLFFLLLPGCRVLGDAIQAEPDLSVVGAAILRTESPLLINGKDSVLIKRVDGAGPRLFEHKWVVTPGWHEVEIEAELNEDTGKDSRLTTKVARVLAVHIHAGRNYLVQAKQLESSVWIWITDEDSGESVAGEAPGDPGLRSP